MSTVGGKLEEKEIGLPIGTSGAHYDTEIDSNGNLRLKVIDVDANNNNIYASEGYWISDVINLGDKFNDYGKLFTTEHLEGSSAFAVLTRTSQDGINWSDWSPIALDGTIQSETKQYIQVRIDLFAGFIASVILISEFDDVDDVDLFAPNEFIETSSGLRLKRAYEYNMTNDLTWVEEGSLHRKAINRNDWLRVDKLSVQGGSNVSFILHDGEYKRWNEITPPSWSSISNIIPPSQQFLDEGMDLLSPLLDRKVETLEPLKMAIKSDILQDGEEGKVFSKTLDLKKYMDIKNMKVEVK